MILELLQSLYASFIQLNDVEFAKVAHTHTHTCKKQPGNPTLNLVIMDFDALKTTASKIK